MAGSATPCSKLGYCVNIKDDPRFREIDLRLGGPIVYAFHTEESVFYIGSSARGLVRVFGKDHRINPLLKAPNIRVSIMYCNTEGEARVLEKELIKFYSPMLNREKINPFLSHINLKKRRRRRK